MPFSYLNMRLRCRSGIVILTLILLILMASNQISYIVNESNIETNMNYFMDKMNARTKRIREVCSSGVYYAGKCHQLRFVQLMCFVQLKADCFDEKFRTVSILT